MVLYTDPMKDKSSSEHMSDRFLRVITHLGMTFFYAISSTRYPWKAWRVFRNLFITEQAQTKLDSALWRKLSKREGLKEAA